MFWASNAHHHVQRSLLRIPAMNQTHPIQASHLMLLIWTSVLSSNQYVAAQTVQWLGYILEGLVFKSWHKQQNYLLSKTSRPAPAPNQAPNSSSFSGSTVATEESLTTHICLVPSLKISGAKTPFNLSPSMAHIGKILLYLSLLPM